MSGITVTGQPDIDQATAEIAVALRDAAAIRIEHDQNYYDEAMRLRDAIMAGTRAMAGSGQPSLADALAGVDHAQGIDARTPPGKFGLGRAHELAALRDLADAVRAYLKTQDAVS